MKFKVAQHTDVGARKVNQDRCGWAIRNNALLLVLCDGLGGYEDGDKAAQIFTQTVIESFENFKPELISDPHKFTTLATIHGHRMINKMAKEVGYSEESHPRTTSVVCVIQNGYAYWGHVGDSRLYLFRNGAPFLRTDDHTATEQLRKDGYISEDDMRLNEHQGPLLRCVGGKLRPVVSLSAEILLQPDDHILLCSDGMWRAHSTQEMASTVCNGNLEDQNVNLVTESVRIMGKHSDNVTSIAVRWQDEATSSPPLQPRRYSGPEQIKLWEDEWEQARARRKNRQNPTGTDSGVFDDEFIDDEIEEIDQALSELEAFASTIPQ